MTNKIKETLEGLERILEKLQGANIVLTIGDIQSQVKAINWGKALEEARGELEETNKKLGYEIDNLKSELSSERLYSKQLDQELQSSKAKVEELEEEIRRLKNDK